MSKTEAIEKKKRGPHVVSSPPPPHDPLDRILVGHLDDWQIRIFDPAGRWHQYFAPRGLLHLQLWSPKHGVSLITPSELTCHRYEVYQQDLWKYAHRELQSVREILKKTSNVELPAERQLISLEYGWVDTVAAAARASSRKTITKSTNQKGNKQCQF